MKQDASFFEGQDPILVYIARRLGDATRLEALLTAGGVDYGVEADHYTGGVIFRRQRVGAFIYVLPGSLEAVRQIMLRNGYQIHEEAG